jgi:simple sugar transport system permease protein
VAETFAHQKGGGMILVFFGSVFRVSTPLLFAAMGGMLSERSGVINIALEGLMLIGAFAAAVAANSLQSPWAGAAAGIAAGVALAAVYALFVITFRTNQIVAGTAVNMLAAGVVPLLSKILYNSTGSTPALPLEARFHLFPILFAFALVPLAWAGMSRTVFGLRLRFAGEKPEALDAAGISVNRMRWSAVLLSGALAGMGGVSLSIFVSSSL